ncbi:MAG TPA: hypothetical protein VJ963_08980, partial [Bacteroidales bacterium]|nr:hypothetical protein [Bacteroidales bacterium]
MKTRHPEFGIPLNRIVYTGKSILILAVFLFASEFNMKAQKTKDVEIVLECVEYIGNGTYKANFGYDNPNKTDVVVPDTNSTLIYDGGNKKLKALHNFKSGRQVNAFQGVFTSNERVLWHVILPNGTVKDVTASINSNHCTGQSNIYPYYTPPPGGKLSNTVIGPELTSLYNSYVATGSATSDYIFQIKNGAVLIEVGAIGGYYNTVLNLLVQSLGFVVESQDVTDNKVTGWFPIANLMSLNNYSSSIEYAQPVFQTIINNSGLAIDLGDFSMRSDFLRNGYGISGKGVKVGVISDSYNSKGVASVDVANGDLPGTGNIDGDFQQVQVLKDYPYTFTPLSDEGRAMLQIVHDIAPGADLAFRTGYIDPSDMAAGIDELADAGCNVIVDDITYITEPFFRDSPISQAIDSVTAGGVSYFSAAGNFGTKSYSAVFTPYTGKSVRGIAGTPHDFGGGDIYQSISLVEGDYIIVLQWDDDSNAKNDYDIYLSDVSGTTLFGFNRDNLGKEPIEILPFTVKGGNATTNIVISRAAGTDNSRLKYVVFRGDISINEYNTGTSTIVGHADAEGANTVGAVKYDNTPYYGVNPPTIASFSSRGGTPVNGVVRQKPDFTAPNG